MESFALHAFQATLAVVVQIVTSILFLTAMGAKRVAPEDEQTPAPHRSTASFFGSLDTLSCQHFCMYRRRTSGTPSSSAAGAPTPKRAGPKSSAGSAKQGPAKPDCIPGTNSKLITRMHDALDGLKTCPSQGMAGKSSIHAAWMHHQHSA
jgi:hypothetical protein